MLDVGIQLKHCSMKIYENILVDKVKALIMNPTGTEAITIYSTMIHAAHKMPMEDFGSKLPPLSNKLKSNW